MAKLLRCNLGASVVEFALVAPLFIGMLFGLIEISRGFWIKQTLDQVAYSTARCMSVDSLCGTTSQQKTYAVQSAADLGVTIAQSNVTVSGSTTCKGNSLSNSVTISRAFTSPASGIVAALPSTITAHGCFPVLS